MGMTREEAIRRIKDHIRIHLRQEPFRACHIQEALGMAVDALKTQEPRVMTLDEVKASKGGDLYLELSDSPNDVPYITASTLDGVGKYGVSFYHTVCDFSTYGRRAYGWRCWTSRPTDEQREATSWEKETEKM